MNTVEAEVLYEKQKNREVYILIVETPSLLALRILAIRLTAFKQCIRVFFFGNIKKERLKDTCIKGCSKKKANQIIL